MSKVALVTGGGHGIGKGIALELAYAGYDVAVSFSTSPELAEKTAEEIRSLGCRSIALKADLRELTEIGTLFDVLEQQLGPLDVLVNNAGLTKYAPFLETSPELFAEIVHIDFQGTFFCAQRAAKDMIRNGKRGVIINISSNHRMTSFPKDSVYGPAKAAVYKLTQNIALELAPYGIRCNSISPGYIKVTDPSVVTPRERMMVSRIPAQHIGQPGDIAKLVRFLVSEEAEYITGADFLVDGGATLPALMDNTFVKGE